MYLCVVYLNQKTNYGCFIRTQNSQSDDRSHRFIFRKRSKVKYTNLTIKLIQLHSIKHLKMCPSSDFLPNSRHLPVVYGGRQLKGSSNVTWNTFHILYILVSRLMKIKFSTKDYPTKNVIENPAAYFAFHRNNSWFTKPHIPKYIQTKFKTYV